LPGACSFPYTTLFRSCVKHFAVNNQETDRLRISADVDERALREIYLPAFEHVVTRARPWAVMCSYNRINGVHAAQSRWLLTGILDRKSTRLNSSHVKI